MNALLVICLAYGGGWASCPRETFPFPTMAACYEAIDYHKSFLPSGGDAENGYIMFCVPKGNQS